MDDREWLTQQFEAYRAQLRGVAYRILGSQADADDAVQEAWLRISRSDAGVVKNLGGWLTTIVARICLDALRSRKSRGEQPLDEHVPEPATSAEVGSSPETEMLMADSVGLALLVVLDRLAPAERLAYVLHDMFDRPFEEIAAIVDRSPAAARQLASRARRHVQGAAKIGSADLSHQREVAEAFLAAAREGNFGALLAILDPDIVLRADVAAAPDGLAKKVIGAPAVARGALAFSGRVRSARLALVNGAVGVVVAPLGRLSVVLCLTIEHGKIIEIDVIADPARVRRLDLAVLPT
jgi:RNA polymerase sigma-70 factor (ECF subfamily)